MRLILASESRARRQMLEAAGLRFDAVPSGVDEAAAAAALVASGRPAGPAAMARHLALLKALAVSRIDADAIVIGGDQVLALGDEIFSKAPDAAAARAALERLRGRRHELHSAVVVARGGEVIDRAADSARLFMRDFSDAFLDHYVASAGDALTTCVGCYRLEGLGIQLFDEIDGDYATIMGMPLLPLLAILRDCEVIPS